MFKFFKAAAVIAVAAIVPAKAQVGFWLTNPDQSALFQQQKNLQFGKAANNLPAITVNDQQKYQQIDGFGYTLTGGSAVLINKLPADKRKALLDELFLTKGNGIGVSYLRISIGASDLNAEVFTYDDLPEGQTDEQLKQFSLAKDRDMVVILKDILKLNPKIKILGTPWSAPSWMKSNNSSKGGNLLPKYYDVYARYFVKYIKAMQAEGIAIDAITPQNEPLNPKNNPSMVMEAGEEAAFIKTALGPAFKAAGIKTKIITYDHNCDRPDYPMDILKDPEAAKYVDGSAFHLYGGKIDALSTVHDAYPNKHVYFTEQWVGAPGEFPGNLKWHVSQLIVGATRNWARNVLEWNLAADSKYEPHTPGGCTECLGAVTVEQDIKRNVAYYIIAHASKFVRPGSVRIASNLLESFPNVAFKTPEGKTVLIVINTGNDRGAFNIIAKGKSVKAELNAGAVGTFVW
ncbi:glucosylceramidase [Mucilaginibacter sp. RS28]|uniref:Glucosylceramidase n=1 Tax=Mucilaginibacter straminoryzae TaxID=2932774 RepID=A0A9X1X0F0_9SPHI|nr:glycoside hydrolase family 30 beta sandwich domain-containing protein [Mucilaginibacter straminoryzae]MCJ8208947.1 glucosylceramidase [Mucilaginibacter straminoryzae]